MNVKCDATHALSPLPSVAAYPKEASDGRHIAIEILPALSHAPCILPVLRYILTALFHFSLCPVTLLDKRRLFLFKQSYLIVEFRLVELVAVSR